MSFDFTQPDLTVVDRSLKGKTLFIYGDNGTGKTENAVQFPKPFAIPFENGLNAIPGLPYKKPVKWGDLKKFVKEFRRPEVKAMFDTLIIDTADKMGEMLIKRICADHDVDSIGEANNGFGAYSDIGKYLGEFLDPLTDEGYTVVIIGHHKMTVETDPKTKKEYPRMVPRGDKRVIQTICDLVDIIGCCQSNGFDEEGEEILSSIYFKDGKTFKARSRWNEIVNSVTFTVPNVEKAIVDAIIAKEKNFKAKGIDTTDMFVDRVVKEDTVVISLDELKEKIKLEMKREKELTKGFTFSLSTVTDLFGEGVKIGDVGRKQFEVLEECFDAIKENNDNIEKGNVSLDED